MLNPKFANLLVPMRQRKTIRRVRMREKRRIEIHSQSVLLCPMNPTLEMFRRKLVSVHPFPIGLGIRRVQVQPVLAGNQRKRHLHVRAQFIRCPRFTWVISRDRQSAAQLSRYTFESADIIPLPAVQRDRDFGELSE